MIIKTLLILVLEKRTQDVQNKLIGLNRRHLSDSRGKIRERNRVSSSNTKNWAETNDKKYNSAESLYVNGINLSRNRQVDIIENYLVLYTACKVRLVRLVGY